MQFPLPGSEGYFFPIQLVNKEQQSPKTQAKFLRFRTVGWDNPCVKKKKNNNGEEPGTATGAGVAVHLLHHSPRCTVLQRGVMEEGGPRCTPPMAREGKGEGVTQRNQNPGSPWLCTDGVDALVPRRDRSSLLCYRALAPLQSRHGNRSASGTVPAKARGELTVRLTTYKENHLL